jgi:CRISPR/Cas system CSM-associated protein Csm2 small subunit
MKRKSFHPEVIKRKNDELRKHFKKIDEIIIEKSEEKKKKLEASLSKKAKVLYEAVSQDINCPDYSERYNVCRTIYRKYSIHGTNKPYEKLRLKIIDKLNRLKRLLTEGQTELAFR